jgi:hypothetical protein
MCNYRLYIFSGCGHSTFSLKPVSYCTNATHSAKGTVEEDITPILQARELETMSTSVTIDLNTVSEPEVTKTLRNSIFINQGATNNTKEQRRPMNPASKRDLEVQLCKDGRVHPFHTRRLECMCTGCAQERDERLRALESILERIKIDPRPPQWKYREEGERLPSKRQDIEDLTLVERNAPAQRKVDSGVWSVGTKWMKDWRG